MTTSSLPLYAAIDLGSNTFRFLIARAGSPWHTVCYRHHVVRLGQGLHDSGLLCEEAMQRGVTALADFRRLLDEHGVPSEHVRAVSTSAVRSAANREVFVARVAQETGIHIEVISGDEEAETSLLGSCAVLEPDYAADMLLFDIGGGSTEFVRASHGRAEQAISEPLGVVRLVDACLRSDPPAHADYQAMLARCEQHLDAVERSWQGKKAPAALVGTAGTVTTLAATMLDLYPYDAATINNTIMRHDDFVALRDRLLAMPLCERQAIRTIEPGRADLMIAGCAIVESVLHRWGYDQMVVVDAGLLEGVFLTLAVEAL
jgi:exopolyphosphatase/guanosine-5'-triphosphate,3'-diphosphate pyrophosphatase